MTRIQKWEVFSFLFIVALIYASEELISNWCVIPIVIANVAGFWEGRNKPRRYE